jgi:hypothetical protein
MVGEAMDGRSLRLLILALCYFASFTPNRLLIALAFRLL